jgi:hypothetical protein
MALTKATSGIIKNFIEPETNSTGLGNNALGSVTTGTKNVAIGTNTLAAATIGNQCTAVGYNALAANVHAYQNVAIGNDVMSSVVGVALPSSNGSNNTGIGNQCLEDLTTGENNVAAGAYALQRTTSGIDNNAIGFQSQVQNLTGIKNNSLGMNALYDNTDGDGSIAIGHNALRYADGADYNVSIGFDSGYNLGNAVTAGGYNTFVGYNSGKAMTTGAKNSIFGAFTGDHDGADIDLDIRTSSNRVVLSDGDGNVASWFDAGRNQIMGTNSALVLGSGTSDGVTLYKAGVVVASANGGEAMRLRRRSSDGGIAFFYRDTSVVGSISVTASATAYNTSSDYRLKTDVQPMNGATDRLKALNPVNFQWISDGTRVDGFIAHEIADVIPECVTGAKDAVDADGNPIYQGIDQSKIVPLLVATIKELEARIAALES